jgi:glucose-1-phosphate thymidylyltransferase
MKAIILAGGYASRLWPLTKEQPKHMLPIAGQPMINYLMERLEKLDIETFYLVTNAKFAHNFEEWAKTCKWKDKIKIVNDQTTSNDDRLGSLGDIMYVINNENIDDDVFVIGADNLSDFDFNRMILKFNEKKTAIIASYDAKDEEVVRQNSQVSVGEDDKVLEYIEKPAVPTSTMIGALMWVIPKNDVPLIQECIDMDRSDKAGWFIIHLLTKRTVHNVTYEGLWIDIGTHETYKRAQEIFEKEPGI